MLIQAYIVACFTNCLLRLFIKVSELMYFISNKCSVNVRFAIDKVIERTVTQHLLGESSYNFFH